MQLLHADSSPLNDGNGSVSGRLTAAIVAAWRHADR
jgi:hypothetical protein